VLASQKPILFQFCSLPNSPNCDPNPIDPVIFFTLKYFSLLLHNIHPHLFIIQSLRQISNDCFYFLYFLPKRNLLC
jgi:hypothetical protein